MLRDAVGEGRLTLEEFSERIRRAHAARSDQDLASLIHDLPVTPATSSQPAAGPERHRAFCNR